MSHTAGYEMPPEGRKPAPGSCRYEAQEVTNLPLYNEPLMERMRELYAESGGSMELSTARLAYEGTGLRRQRPERPDELAWNQGVNLPMAAAVAQEINIASADFDCQVSTLLPAERALESRIVETLIEEFPEAVP